ncbi:SirB2 family protein [Azovibrio restrictus]|uniref:SirB2 family protein n=1 Tax=Azovibrio restrictus TaxID=146938 RepID=UPI0026F32BB2|nr:SirB2 family protein [Azovibrio restrictus]
MYPVLKHIHLTCVLLSGLGFLLRGYWRFVAPWRLERGWVRWLPHGVDTLLLVSALMMVWMSGQYPFVQPWLTAKVLALLAYIVCGSLALKRARTVPGRGLAFVLAVCSFAYIVSVALTRRPMPWAA